MTIVFVHGNPETEAVWDDLVPHLRNHDVVRLSPPGFGSAIPSGFDCSTDAYRDWLAVELGKLAQPIDLVGHDWGGGHVVRIAMDRPDLIRSWASDILGGFDPDYVWHDMAQAWQTVGIGEQAVAQMASMPAEARVRAVREPGHDQGNRSESDRRCERGHGSSDFVAVQISRSTGDARSRGELAASRCQTRPSDYRYGRFLCWRRNARAPFCRARRRKSRSAGRSGSLVDVPAAQTRSGCDKLVLGKPQLGQVFFG